MSDDKSRLGYLVAAAVDGEYGKVVVTVRRFSENEDGTLRDSNTIASWEGQANVKSRRATDRPADEGHAFICDNMYDGRDADWKVLRDDMGHWYALKVSWPGNRWTVDGALEELEEVRRLLVKISKALKKFRATYPDARLGDELQSLTVGLRAAGIKPVRQNHENYTTTYRWQA